MTLLQLEDRVLTTDHGYMELTPSNYERILAGETTAPADVVGRMLAQTLNGDESAERTSICFPVSREQMIPIIRGMASLTFELYGRPRVGFIDMAQAIKTDEHTEGTVERIGVVRGDRDMNLIAVAANIEVASDMDEVERVAQAQRAANVYTALEQLPVNRYHAAIIGEMVAATAAVQA